MAKVSDGYIINPEPFWAPVYRISPFSTPHVQKNREIVKSSVSDHKLLVQLFGPDFVFCNSGKHAISLALKCYNLAPHDEVWIVTTSGNKYISSCVTREIEKVCKWSMHRSADTRLIFVNHEFGYCYPELSALKQFDLPIVEDRALSFASFDKQGETGKAGDFVIYSLPKFFPINLGGVLQINKAPAMDLSLHIDKSVEAWMAPLLTYYAEQIPLIRDQRHLNYGYLAEKFASIGISPRFSGSETEVPGVFMFTALGINLPELKVFMQANGVESSIFYGEDSFFIPVHQGLTYDDLDFLFHLVSYYIKNGN